MYLPSHFEETRTEVLHGLIRTHPLGLLIAQHADGPSADSVPFIIDPEPAPHGTLRAHVARANPLWRTAHAQPVLIVFQGPQAYVSPSAYPGKAEHGKVVPTWNYVMVQARGTLRAVEDAAWLHAFVTRLTERHESGRAAPWAVSDAPADYIEKMLGAIVGIEIALTALAGKWKVSQNKPAADRQGIARLLDAEGGEAAAQARQVARQVEQPGSG